MSAEKLTQDEAQRLLDMLKRSLIDAINFPTRGTTKEFDVIGDTKTDIFSINIYIEQKSSHINIIWVLE